MGEGKKHLFEKVEKMHADVAEAAPIERRLVGGGLRGGDLAPPPCRSPPNRLQPLNARSHIPATCHLFDATSSSHIMFFHTNNLLFNRELTHTIARAKRGGQWTGRRRRASSSA